MTLTELAIRITADNDEALTEFASQYKGVWCKEAPDLGKTIVTVSITMVTY